MTHVGRWRVWALRTLVDGTVQTEALGVFEATMGSKARDKARVQNAGRFGWTRTARGWRMGGWHFQVTLERL
jgi:hypothetical protein